MYYVHGNTAIQIKYIQKRHLKTGALSAPRIIFWTVWKFFLPLQLWECIYTAVEVLVLKVLVIILINCLSCNANQKIAAILPEYLWYEIYVKK